MKIAFITTDAQTGKRSENAAESDTSPIFGIAPEALLIGFSEIPGVEVHVISCERTALVTPRSLAPNIFFHPVYVPRGGWGRTLFFGCASRVHRLLAEIQPDIVHGQGTERECAVSAVYGGHPSVVTVHGNMRQMSRGFADGAKAYYWIVSVLESICLRKADAIICLSEHAKDLVRYSSAKKYLIPNAVHPAFFAVRPQPPASPVLFCPGTIAAHKNQAALIEALDSIPSDERPALRFAGLMNPARAYSRTVIAMIDERPWCRYLGHLSRHQMFDELSAATAVVLPSLVDNLPLTIIEAMSAGVPVIASRTGGIPELVDEGVTGFLFDADNQSQIREAVTKILFSPERAARLGAAAKEIAKTRFTPNVVAREHAAVYQQLLDSIREVARNV